MKKLKLLKTFLPIYITLICPNIANAQVIDTATKLEVDHIFFLTKNAKEVINKLQDAGFTPATKWATKHKGQGTTGYFFFFLNTYIEILAITDTAEANNNAAKFGHSYANRLKKDYSKTGIGLRQIPLKKVTFPFTTVNYQQKWMGKDTLYMASSNTNLNQPIVFIEPPSFANLVVNKLEDLDQYAKQNPDMKTYRQHAAKVEKLTSIEIFTNQKKDKWAAAFKYLKNFTNATIAKAKNNLTVLIFDNGKQQKQIDLTETLQLIIKY